MSEFLANDGKEIWWRYATIVALEHRPMEESFSVSTCSIGTIIDRSRIRIHRHRDRSQSQSPQCHCIHRIVVRYFQRCLTKYHVFPTYVGDISASSILPSFSELRVNQIYNTTRTEWVPWLHSSHPNVLVPKAEITRNTHSHDKFYISLLKFSTIRFVAAVTLISYRLKSSQLKLLRSTLRRVCT